MSSVLGGSEHAGYNAARDMLCSLQVNSIPDECHRNYTPEVKHTHSLLDRYEHVQY